MFLDNVTTIVIFVPLTILITRIMNLNPQSYLMAEAMLSNIGGVATLVGDPPNIMIGSAAGIHWITHRRYGKYYLYFRVRALRNS